MPTFIVRNLFKELIYLYFFLQVPESVNSYGKNQLIKKYQRKDFNAKIQSRARRQNIGGRGQAFQQPRGF